MKQKSQFSLIILLLMTMVTVTCKKDEKPAVKPNPGTLEGSVSNEYNQFLTGAVVTVKGSSINTSIEISGGKYAIKLEPGEYILSVKNDGYIEAAAAVTTFAGRHAQERLCFEIRNRLLEFIV